MKAINQISNIWRLMLAICAVVCVFAFASPRASAQCEPAWQPFDPSTASVPGTSASVQATTLWDPDGPGPQTPKLVVGGSFTRAGTVQANKIAVYDPSNGRWSALGLGLGETGVVYALAVLPNGDLVAAGTFSTAGGVSANRIARWNGSVWSPLRSGMNGTVYALAVLRNGDLVAGGDFTSADGVSANHIARWDGSEWLPLSSGMSGGSFPNVSALAVMPNGDLVAGGVFTSAGGMSANRIARWNGSSWSPLGSGVSAGVSTAVRSLAVLSNGDLVAGGDFTTAGGMSASRIARWNGSSWSPLGSGVSAGASVATVRSLAVLSNGDLVAGGEITTAGGVNVNRIARWNGSAWSPLGSGVNGSLAALAVLPTGDLVAGGGFSTAGGVSASGVARWNGTAWSPLASALGMSFSAITVLPNGDLIAGGQLTVAGGMSDSIARWNGSDWSQLGSGMNGRPYALAVLPNNDLVAGGQFTIAGGVNTERIARWNGTVWLPLGWGLSGGDANALAVLPNGDLVAGGFFTTASGVSANRIARWNGSVWSSLGSGMNEGVDALAVLPNGDIVAGGFFTTAGGVNANRIARWNGSVWSPLGSGMSGGSLPSVYALVVMPNGDLVAGGNFTSAGGVSANRIARWNGSIWSRLAQGFDGPVEALAVMPNGDLIAGGPFLTAGGVSANRIARWNGSAWSALGSGVNSSVEGLVVLPNGDLVAEGSFNTAGEDVVAIRIARWATPVPPAIASQPQSQSIAPGDVLVLTASPAAGSAAVSIQWKRNGTNITNGPGGASSGGGTVAGASDSMGSITNGTPATLIISNFQPSDAGSYTATFSISCGSITSLPATITITPPPCAADFNADTVLDFFDYLDFVAAFAANQPAADFNADTVIDFFDYLDFVAEFANGC